MGEAKRRQQAGAATPQRRRRSRQEIESDIRRLMKQRGDNCSLCGEPGRVLTAEEIAALAATYADGFGGGGATQ